MISRLLDIKRNASTLYRRAFVLYWSLPYELRKTIFHVILPQQYRQWQALRHRTEPDENNHWLAPFDRHRCIFVHIPKCAGASVAQSLFESWAGGHKTIVQYQLIFSKQEFESYFKFSIVRNPWDRLVSAFTFLRQGGLTKEDRMWAEKNIASFASFHRFVTTWVNFTNIYSYHHFIPQHEFLLDPKTQKLSVDFVGRFENLGLDFQQICRNMNVSAELLEQNKTLGRNMDYRTYYDSETKNIVAKVYEKDIELFKYVF